MTAKGILASVGIEVKMPKRTPPTSICRPIGNIRSFLEDVRARGFTPKGIIDVGAHKGDWTLMASSVYPEANFIMIEPQDEMTTYLEKICSNNPKCEYVKAGVGRENSVLTQTIWDDYAGSSFLPEANTQQLARGIQRKTKVISIDHVLESRNGFSPDLIKVDVQGFELEVMRGACSAFGNTELVILETNLFEFIQGMPLAIDCINYMHQNGYQIYDITEFLRRPYDGALGQVDFAFAKNQGILRSSNQWS